MAGRWWREKLYCEMNNLKLEKEQPSKEEGLQSLDKMCEDGWLVLDRTQAKGIPPATEAVMVHSE